MLPNDLSEIVLQGQALRHILIFAAGGQVIETCRKRSRVQSGRELRERLGAHVGHTELLREVLAVTLRQARAVAATEADAKFVDRGRVQSVGVGEHDIPHVDGYRDRRIEQPGR